jgi:AcrR family transcriptional regulator
MLGDTVNLGHSPDGSDETPRQRLIGALSASIEEVGYAATTVTDIVRRAKTSRRTFYDFFVDREACLVALLTHINTQGIRSIRAAIDVEAPWEVQIAQAVRAWIENAAPQSAVMLSWIRETPGLGHAARQHKLEVTEAYIHLIQSFSDTPMHRAAGYEKVARSQAIMFIGGLRELTALTLERGGRIQDMIDDATIAALALFSPHQAPAPVLPARSQQQASNTCS